MECELYRKIEKEKGQIRKPAQVQGKQDEQIVKKLKGSQRVD